MKCLRCGERMKVVDSRPILHNTEKFWRRRYECTHCKYRLSVAEIEEETFERYKKRATDAEIKLYELKKKLREVLNGTADV